MLEKSIAEDKYRKTLALSAIPIAFVFITVLFYLLPTPVNDSGMDLGVVLLDRSFEFYPFTIQNIMWVIFFVAMGELWVRFNRASIERNQLFRELLPEDENTMLRSKELVPIYKSIKSEVGCAHYFLQKLSLRTILQFQLSQSVEQSNNLLNSSLELLQHEIDLKYNMIRYLVWLIPTLGFIGTVIGIAMALSKVAEMPDVMAGEDIRPWLALVTTELGTAFYTTLLALVLSAVLVFFFHIAQAREELALNKAGQYCFDNLINKLYVDKA